MNKITETLLSKISDYMGSYSGAYNIRENSQCAGRHSTDNIKIESKEDKPGINIRIAAGTKGEKVFIPACVTQSHIDDLVYNDFFVGEGADVTIVAGCGVHVDDGHDARHNGIHRFFLEKNSRVLYEEKHIGTGEGSGNRYIDPVTEVFLEEDATLEMDTVQLSGVDYSTRRTHATLGPRSKLYIRERLLTDGEQEAKTDFEVHINGEDAGVNLISRSVARGNSTQEYRSRIYGNNRCTGHSECDAIIADNGKVSAAPELVANHEGAALIHEAAIGKIAGEQIMKLRTLGLTEQEAEAKIVSGFLK